MPEQTKTKKEEHGKILASWTFPEFIQYQRGIGWYIIIGLVGIGLLVWTILTANFLFALIIILVAIITLLHSRRQPSQVEIQITEDGIKVSSKFYEWGDLKNFWIIYEPPEVKTLYINSKSNLTPALSVPLEDESPVEIRKILLTCLEEDLTQDHESAAS
jgi:hypothetical protein